MREARAMLRHDNIVTLYQFIEEWDSMYLVMELVPGGSLQDLIKGRARLTTKEALWNRSVRLPPPSITRIREASFTGISSQATFS